MAADDVFPNVTAFAAVLRQLHAAVSDFDLADGQLAHGFSPLRKGRGITTHRELKEKPAM